ncbi:MAG TPA: aminotransferase class I/II-fold pyridoxal phosphate-dependent enzyme [Gemmatimonadaceae bacterium]|nr:aminotransferase class I/II-fold pyridoxal phosphate-dependent enzyme [Gemmatimonadaceae bacterium]
MMPDQLRGLPSVLARCEAYTLPEETKAAGLYAFFRPSAQTTATEALVEGAWRIMVGSNNYLGLTHHPHVLEAQHAALERYGSGSTGSRWLNGTLDLHEELEARLATLLRKEAALVFTTGYQASLGAVSGFIGRDDHLFLDKLDHASIVDGARLAAGQVHRYNHGDFDQLERRLANAPEGAGKLIVSDGIFSMEGTIVDLPRLARIARHHGAALLIDDAHALGVLGDDGAGTARHFGLDDDVDLVMATFSKSLASVGGVVAGAAAAISYLRHHSRALMFTASAPPAAVAGALAALDVMADEPERRERLWSNTHRMANGLRSLGFDLGGSETPIIPVLVGELTRTLQVWRALFDDGVFAHPILPPAVGPSSCRIRVSVSAEHTDEQIDRVLEAFARVRGLILG